MLRGVSFAVGPGQTTAIVGSTGAGKTTLVNLIPRLFDVTSGAVLVDGVDVRDLDEELLWGRIGVVPQTAYLFSGTIASNLRYGRPDATDDEMWDALEVAQAADFVRAMPGRPAGAGGPGRHQPVGWATPAPGHRQGADPSPGDLPLRRRLLGARPRHRRPPACRARAADARRRGDHRRPTGLDDHRRRRRSSCSRTASSSASAATTSCSRPARPTSRSSSRRLRRRRRRDRRAPIRGHRLPGFRPPPATCRGAGRWRTSARRPRRRCTSARRWAASSSGSAPIASACSSSSACAQ